MNIQQTSKNIIRLMEKNYVGKEFHSLAVQGKELLP